MAKLTSSTAWTAPLGRAKNAPDMIGKCLTRLRTSTRGGLIGFLLDGVPPPAGPRPWRGAVLADRDGEWRQGARVCTDVPAPSALVLPVLLRPPVRATSRPPRRRCGR